jgi:hypothetical protein
VYFQVLADRAPFDQEPKRLELQHRFNQIPGVRIPSDRLRLYPAIPLAALRSESAMAQFIEALEWVIVEVRAADSSHK